MKKVFFLALIICTVILSSCGNGISQIFEEYPRVVYQASDYTFDMENQVIEVFDGYKIDPDQPFEWHKTKEGYVLIVKFIEEDSDGTDQN